MHRTSRRIRLLALTPSILFDTPPAAAQHAHSPPTKSASAHQASSCRRPGNQACPTIAWC